MTKYKNLSALLKIRTKNFYLDLYLHLFVGFSLLLLAVTAIYLYFKVLSDVYVLLKNVSLFAVAGFLVARFYSGIEELKVLFSLTDAEVAYFGPSTVFAAKFLAAGKVCLSCALGTGAVLGAVDTYIETKSMAKDGLGQVHTGSPIKAFIDFKEGTITKDQFYKEVENPRITARRLAEEANKTYEEFNARGKK